MNKAIARKLGVSLVALLMILSLAGFLWVRSVFAHDAVRMALASQISSALGQPVAIESIGASFLPRVTIKLQGVSIGQPARIQAKTLRLGTDFRALLSRQIVHGTVHLDGARVDLPLLPLGATTDSTASPATSAPVEIVSIDEIVLHEVEIVSAGRVLRGDIEAVPHAAGATLRRIALSAEDTSVTGTGEITSLSGPVGEIAISAKALNFAKLLDFLAAFSGGSGMAGQTTSARAAAPPTDLTLSLTADRATMGTLAFEKLTGRARVTRDAVRLEPIEFGVFGGGFKGAMTLAAAATPTFQVTADVSNIDVAALTTYAGSSGVLSGRLSGRLQLTGQSSAAPGAMNATQGTARVDIRDGVVRKLGLVRTIVVATSMRSDATIAAANASTDEPFSRLGATLRFAKGIAQTSDLQFVSPDVLMSAVGWLKLDGSAINLQGNVQLSDALSRQAGRDLVRYTQEQGRVTVPATITGSAQTPSVSIDVAGLARRALQNKAIEEVNKAIGKKLGELFKR